MVATQVAIYQLNLELIFVVKYKTYGCFVSLLRLCLFRRKMFSKKFPIFQCCMIENCGQIENLFGLPRKPSLISIK